MKAGEDMLCQKCNEKEATIHYTNIVNGMKVETHLCPICAKEKGDLFMSMDQFVLPAPLQQFIAGLLLSDAQHMVGEAEPSTAVCPFCGLSYGQFLKQGKFQCPDCYVTFEEALYPLFEKLHNKNKRHVGKIPKRGGENMIIRQQLATLKLHLKEMIAIENFEEAARIRDEIRALEKRCISKGGGSDE